jgi:hypothetical protein
VSETQRFDPLRGQQTKATQHYNPKFRHVTSHLSRLHVGPTSLYKSGPVRTSSDHRRRQRHSHTAQRTATALARRRSDPPFPAAMAGRLDLQGRHGKSRVRVSRVWRRPAAAGGHLFVEWSVAVSVVSDCLPSYTSDDNSAIVATDSIKNTVRSPTTLSPPRFSPSVVLLLTGFLFFARSGVCQGQGVHGGGVHGGIRRHSRKAFHLPVPTGNGILSGSASARGNVWDSHGYFSGVSFVSRQVSEATVTIVERPWERVVVDGKPHSHGETSFYLILLV